MSKGEPMMIQFTNTHHQTDFNVLIRKLFLATDKLEKLICRFDKQQFASSYIFMNTSEDANNKTKPIQPFHWERYGLHTRLMMNQGMACKSLCWEFSRERMSPGLTCMPPSSSSMMCWPAPGTTSMRTPTIWLQNIPKDIDMDPSNLFYNSRQIQTLTCISSRLAVVSASREWRYNWMIHRSFIAH